LKQASVVAKELKLEGHFGGRKDKRMKAEELVIRYWSIRNGIGQYEKPLASFISSYAEDNRNMDEEELARLSDSVRMAHSRCVRLFDKNCFTFKKSDKSRFNAAVFDAQMIPCSRLSEVSFKKLISQVSEVRRAYDVLQENAEYAKSVTLATSDKAALQGRIFKVAALFKAFL
jgi:hypothetical protein